MVMILIINVSKFRYNSGDRVRTILQLIEKDRSFSTNIIFSSIFNSSLNKTYSMKKITIALISIFVFFQLRAQNVGIRETNPKATLEIKGSTMTPDSNALMIRNSNNDTLFKMNNEGTAVIGSVQRDFGQLQIISNAKLGYSNLQLTGTNFGGNTGIHFSDLIFNGTATNKYWRIASRLNGPDNTDNYSANNYFSIHTDSLSNFLNLTGEGKMGLGSNTPKAYLEIKNDAGGSTITPQLSLVGTGLASRSYIHFTSADQLNYWYMRGQHNGGFNNFIIGLNENNPFFGMDETGQTFIGGGGGLNDGQVNISFNSNLSKAHLSLYETDANDFARIIFQNASSNTDNWQIAGLINATPANAKLNFYHNVFGNVMSLTGDGKVGIGNASPLLGGLVADTKVGAVNALFGSNTSGVAIESSFPGFGLNSYFNAGRKFISNGYAGYMGFDPANGTLIFSNSPATGLPGASAAIADRMYIIRTGEVGINKTPLSTSNDSRLQVKQTGAQNGIGIEAAGTTNHWDFYVSGTNLLTLYYNGVAKGNFDAVTGNYVATSDKRFKKDINELAIISKNLLLLKTFQYHYSDNQSYDPLSIGFMAQDVQKIFPDAVHEIDMKDGTKRLGINYQYFTVLAVKGWQEQQARIETLEERVNKLEKIIKEMHVQK